MRRTVIKVVINGKVSAKAFTCGKIYPKAESNAVRNSPGLPGSMIGRKDNQS
jgi:hypothetical protein